MAIDQFEGNINLGGSEDIGLNKKLAERLSIPGFKGSNNPLQWVQTCPRRRGMLMIAGVIVYAGTVKISVS